jgi:hypothetical protein
MDPVVLKRALVMVILAVLFHFYWTYFQVTARARKRLEPWARALKRFTW